MSKKVSRLMIGSLAMAVIVATAGCGGDDDDGDAGDGGGSATEANAGAAASIDEVEACLSDAGFEVESGSALPEEAQEALGIEGNLLVSGRDDLVGLGSVTYYEDESTAEEALEASRAVRTEDVVMGREGSVVYDFAGSEAGADALAGCL